MEHFPNQNNDLQELQQELDQQSMPAEEWPMERDFDKNEL